MDIYIYIIYMYIYTCIHQLKMVFIYYYHDVYMYIYKYTPDIHICNLFIFKRLVCCVYDNIMYDRIFIYMYDRIYTGIIPSQGCIILYTLVPSAHGTMVRSYTSL